MTLETSIQYLPGVGPKRARLLQDELGTGTVGDLLRLYPFRYIDRTAVQRIADLLPDQAYIQIRATVRSVKLLGKGGKPADPAKAGAGMRLSAIVEDGSGEIEVVFFKGVKWMVTRIVPGATFIFFGKPTVYGGVDIPAHGAVGAWVLMKAEQPLVLDAVHRLIDIIKADLIERSIEGNAACALSGIDDTRFFELRENPADDDGIDPCAG